MVYPVSEQFWLANFKKIPQLLKIFSNHVSITLKFEKKIKHSISFKMENAVRFPTLTYFNWENSWHLEYFFLVKVHWENSKTRISFQKSLNYFFAFFLSRLCYPDFFFQNTKKNSSNKIFISPNFQFLEEKTFFILLLAITQLLIFDKTFILFYQKLVTWKRCILLKFHKFNLCGYKFNFKFLSLPPYPLPQL